MTPYNPLSARLQPRASSPSLLLLPCFVIVAACSSDSADPLPSDVDAQGQDTVDAEVTDAASDDTSDLDIPPEDTDRPEVLPLPPNGPAPDFVPVATVGAHTVEVIDSRRVLPGPEVPSEAATQNSNNNLDVIRHDGRVWLAWRTAPNHFASADTVIHVISSTDEENWTFEASFQLDTDLREPRFLSFDGQLSLYVAALGTSRLSFDPQGMYVTQRDAATGDWSALARSGPDGFIPWRTGQLNERPVLIGYTGGENIYQFNLEPLQIHMLTTTDGRAWTGFDPQRPIVAEGGGSEAAFAVDGDDRLWAIIRNEAGDDSGWGSKLCSTAPGAYTDWNCTVDPRKFDSPLAFAHDGEVYIVARRNLTETGNYDLGLRDLDPVEQVIRYQANYSQQPKRCAVWRVDRNEHRLRFMLDLPSNGDTCFPSVIALRTPGEYAIYDYTSDPEAELLNWNTGQEGPTYIYRHVLRFSPVE
jgi:hypothetical protein